MDPIESFCSGSTLSTELVPPYTLSWNRQLACLPVLGGSHILIVQRLNKHQDILGLRDSLFEAWNMRYRGSAHIIDANTVRFVFFNEQHQNFVVDNSPWFYGNWSVVIDYWKNRYRTDFLSSIPLWAKITNIPKSFQTHGALMEIGGLIGESMETRFPGFDKPHTGETWVRIRVGVRGRLKFALPIKFRRMTTPIILRISYEKLVNFCHSCGSINHAAEACLSSRTIVRCRPPHIDECNSQSPALALYEMNTAFPTAVPPIFRNRGNPRRGPCAVGQSTNGKPFVNTSHSINAASTRILSEIDVNTERSYQSKGKGSIRRSRMSPPDIYSRNIITRQSPSTCGAPMNSHPPNTSFRNTKDENKFGVDH